MLMAGAGFGAAFAFALSAGHGFKESAACREITSPEARAAAVERERRETEQKRAAAAAETTRVHLQDLRKQAKTATRENDCATTRELAAHARELDDAYFHIFIAADPELAPCLSPEPASP
jgi:hypothetical protein